jgi:hypothetical protein
MATPTALPTAFVAGDILTAANQNLLRGAFRVLQVVTATYATQVISSVTALADTGLTASITPQYSSSKVLVIVQQGNSGKLVGNVLSRLTMKLYRGATDLGTFCDSVGYTATSIDNWVGTVGHIYLDSPATTSSTTYKTQFANQVAASGAIVQANASTSSILLMEISA